MAYAKRRAINAAQLVVTVAAALCLGGCSLFTPSRADDPQTAVAVTRVDSSAFIKEGVLTVALDTTNVPQAMKAEDGTLSGYEVDLGRALAQRLGLTAEFVDAGDAEKALTSGEADIYLGASQTSSSKIQVLGTCLEDAPALFAKGQESVSDASALEGATIGVQTASAAQDALSKAGINANQTTYSNVNECFKALSNGEVQYVACDAAAGAYLARAYDGVSFAGSLGSSSSSGVAVLAKNEKLSQAIDNLLGTMDTDGTLEAVHTMWYGGLPFRLSDSLLSGITIADTTEQAAGEDSDSSSDVSSDGDNNSVDGSSSDADSPSSASSSTTQDINSPDDM